MACLCTAVSAFLRNLLLSRAILACLKGDFQITATKIVVVNEMCQKRN
jgi:hypothetical protein